MIISRDNMKELHCKVCGSANIVRKDEVYICESCNKEYSALEIIQLTEDDIETEHKTLKLNKGSIAEKSRRFHKVKSLSYYENLLKTNPNDWQGHFYVVYLNAQKAQINEIIPSISKLINASRKSLKLIKENIESPEKQMEALMQISGAFQIIAATYKNTNALNKTDNEALINRTNKEWTLRVEQLTKMFYSFGDEVKDLFGDDFEFIYLNSWKTGVWYNLDIVPLSDNKEAQINKIKEYELKIKKEDEEYDSKLKSKYGIDIGEKENDSFFKRIFKKS